MYIKKVYVDVGMINVGLSVECETWSTNLEGILIYNINPPFILNFLPKFSSRYVAIWRRDYLNLSKTIMG